ncbi:MAG: AraC family transcriptional regulator, partial [Lachnospiraceae bacterium]|nr:AraC family transcriptional regulator [Lachnospiraceae bacterium]
ADSSSYLRDMEIHEKLSSLLLNIMKESWNKNLNDNESETSLEKRKDIKLIREYIEENYDKDIKLDDLAKSYNISKYYLSHIFKEQYGTSITNYIINTRITKAKHLLRFSDLTTTEIANQVGYEDANYFIRMFKKVENITPGEYKKKW